MNSAHFQFSSSSPDIFPRPLILDEDEEYGLAQTEGERLKAIISTPEENKLSAFRRQPSELGDTTLLVYFRTPQHAAALRNQKTWLQPRPLGLKTSLGTSDIFLKTMHTCASK